ncbi:MAG: hypothetical protein IKL07_01745 [Clostridium sp.]|nr:hypothetical protein [Clostridium sp.]
MNIDKKLEGQVSVRVRSGEVDSYRIAHHSNYIVWYEIGRVHYLETYLADWLKETSLLNKQGKLEYIKSRFVNPAHIDDVLNVYTKLEGVEELDDKVILTFKQKILNNTTRKMANTSVAKVSYEIVGDKSGLGT